MHDLIAIAAVLLVLGLLLAILRAWQVRFQPHAESARKALHMGMGTVTLAFPWLFSSPLPVLALGFLAFLFLALVRRRGLPGACGEVLHAVKRPSWGDLLFPPGVAVLFFLSGGDPLYYWPPLMVLTYADALAALVGTRIGSIRYRTDDGEKTLEGSIAFFLTAFTATLASVWFWDAVSPGRALSVAALFGMVVVIVEAIAWRGLDNFFLPVLGFLFLDAYLALPSEALWIRFVLLLILLAFTFYLKKKTSLNDSALTGAALFGYLAFAVGGVAWVVPPLLLFLAYPRFIPYLIARRTNRQPASGVLAVVLAGIFWLMQHRVAPDPAHLYAYTFTFAVFLAVIWINRIKANRRTMRLPALLALTVLPSHTLIYLPYFTWFAPEHSVLHLAPPVYAAGALVGALVWMRQEELGSAPLPFSGWFFRTGMVGAASLGLFVLAVNVSPA